MRLPYRKLLFHCQFWFYVVILYQPHNFQKVHGIVPPHNGDLFRLNTTDFGVIGVSVVNRVVG